MKPTELQWPLRLAPVSPTDFPVNPTEPEKPSLGPTEPQLTSINLYWAPLTPLESPPNLTKS